MAHRVVLPDVSRAAVGSSTQLKNSNSMTKILSPSTIEHCCRFILGTQTRQGLLPIRIALAASRTHGNDWFRVGEVFQSLNTGGGCASITGELAKRMVQMGIAETQLISTGQGYSVHIARLTCCLVDQSHFHGKKSLKLREQIETFFGLKPDASPVAALLLIGLLVCHICQSRELGRFLLPEFNFDANPSMPGKVLGHLAQARLLAIVRNQKSMSRPFLVYPL